MNTVTPAPAVPVSQAVPALPAVAAQHTEPSRHTMPPRQAVPSRHARPARPAIPALRDQHLRILSLLTEIEPLLAPSARPDVTTLDLRWSVLARWAMVQIELDRARWLAVLAARPDPAGSERARTAIALGESLYARLRRHDRLYAQRVQLTADPQGFVEATRRLARTLRRMVTVAVQCSAGAGIGVGAGVGASAGAGVTS